MKTQFIVVLSLMTLGFLQAQNQDQNQIQEESIELNADSVLAQFESQKEDITESSADDACNCIDSISLFNKTSKEVSGEIGDCINKEVSSYLLRANLLSAIMNSALMLNDSTEEPKSMTINIGEPDENSKEYEEAYFKLERYLFENCEHVKGKVAENNKLAENSISTNMAAITLYEKGNREFAAEEYDKAIKSFKQAVKIDPDFAFAWDNLGLAYRKTERYKKAITAYEKSIEIDPTGLTPRQNLAIVYNYTGDYNKAIEAYESMAEIDDTNPEVYYGIAIIQLAHKQDHVKALKNMCIAYNLYTEQNSPYRSDAEKMISTIYAYMKGQNKEKQFNKILSTYGLSPEKE